MPGPPDFSTSLDPRVPNRRGSCATHLRTPFPVRHILPGRFPTGGLRAHRACSAPAGTSGETCTHLLAHKPTQAPDFLADAHATASSCTPAAPKYLDSRVLQGACSRSLSSSLAS